MAIITREKLLEIVKIELTAGVVNLELSDAIIENNIDRALMLSSDYFSYTDYKTVPVTGTTASGGYIDLKTLDDSGNHIPVIVNVYPTQGTMLLGSQLLGLGSFYLQGNLDTLGSYMTNYSNLINRVSQLESLMGRGAKVVGDKLYLDKYGGEVTIEYIPNIVTIDKIHEGSWIMWIIDYTVALSKQQIAQARGKFVIASNPFTTNSATLLEEAREELIRLEEVLQGKGVLLTMR